MEHKSKFFGRILAIIFIVGGMVGLNVSQLNAQEFDIGGALRYNFFTKSWVQSNEDKLGDFAFDTFRLNVHAESKGIYVDAEYRFYTDAFGGDYLHHGYIGYDFSETSKLHLGVSQVPFGLQPYASHNWFFVLPYYAGFEDDYDAGIKYLHTMGDLDLAFAFYKNAEVPGAGNSRYSVDIVPANPGYTAGNNNEEINQLNARAAYNIDDNMEVGLSVEYGGLYNAGVAAAPNDNDGKGNRFAFAGHFNGNFGPANVKAEYINYQFSPENGGASTDMVTMGSYGAAYNVASEGSFLVGGVSYDLPFTLGPLGFTAYNDYSMMTKSNSNFETTQANTVGFIVKAGGIWSYVDLIVGKNHPWVGPNWTNGLAAGDPNADWEYRFNINMAYYF
ncbi:MAG: hypothetical protein K9N46_11705 [Candidatus Marinimicrobia bacterium]|nr:hypothetical protein [Candidatus Neomarinimicrobiota bacterium]MCF7827373.1 hypothetical protein [Candidatus Neomarinimicrobiota bacterium]MCF7881394.1 hypothetical protein [Candidatus Neomarinimicrobiota bacterium]